MALPDEHIYALQCHSSVSLWQSQQKVIAHAVPGALTELAPVGCRMRCPATDTPPLWNNVAGPSLSRLPMIRKRTPCTLENAADICTKRMPS